ncbi:MAG: C1 family peptidase [Bacteroidota bacterium]
MPRFFSLLTLFCLFALQHVQAQFTFTPDIKLTATSIKDQSNSSTCWSFATTSFIESELMRMGKGEVDLSEMFFVWNIYPQKAVNYVRWHGKVFLTPGGQPHDVMNVIRTYGMMPEKAYCGKDANMVGYNHARMDTLIKEKVKLFMQNGMNGGYQKLEDDVRSILRLNMGEPPVDFKFNNTTYTPKEFARSLEFTPDNYIELTSYDHHPWYKPFVLETKYNWSHDLYYNLPFDEFFGTIDTALQNGYTVLWNGDVSEKEFSYEYGLALVPEKKWDDKSTEEKDNTFLKPEKEVKADAALRQTTFETLESKVDHVMHIVGTAHDQFGKKYYMVKNSWGDTELTGGLIYMSEAYLKLKTISIMVNKSALPDRIMKKLNQ